MGLGRGRQVVSTAKTADLILVVMDITKATDQRKQMEAELEAVGIRLNTRPPDVVVKQKAAGGVSVATGRSRSIRMTNGPFLAIQITVRMKTTFALSAL